MSILRLFGIAGLICCALSAAAQAKAGQLRGGKLFFLALGLVLWAIGLVLSFRGV
ncbi:MAG: hypothetical protein WBW33_16325 [Bryobacteraceae bacterium]